MKRYFNNLSEKNQKNYSLRKYKVGVISALVSSIFIFGLYNDTTKAAEVENRQFNSTNGAAGHNYYSTLNPVLTTSLNAGSANGPQYNYYGRNTGANYFGALNPINTTSLDSGRSNSLSLPSQSANSSSTNNQSIPTNVQGQSSNQNGSLSPEDQLKSSVGNVLGKDAVSVDQYGTVTLSDGTQVPSLGGFTGS